jgi:hypothetical protein
MEKVQIIPPPKDVNPILLAWKGGAVLGKMDGVTDLWITASDWVRAAPISFIICCDQLVISGHLGHAWSQRKMLLFVKPVADDTIPNKRERRHDDGGWAYGFGYS